MARRGGRGRRHDGAHRPWHVAVVVENVPAGVDTRLRKQLDDLLAEGFSVSVVTRRAADNDPYRTRPGLRLLEYPDPPEAHGPLGFAVEYLLSLAWTTLHVARLRAGGRIDVLQLCQPPDIYFPLAWAVRAAGARVVVDQRDLMPELLASRYGDRAPAGLDAALRWLERRSQAVAHHTVTVNDRLRERLVGAGADPTRLSIVRNGPVQARVERTRPDESLRRGHRHLVCWAGKMGPQDRVDLVLQLAERVVHGLGRQDCGFTVLGDGECLDDLRRQTADRGLAPWVHFTGWVSEEEVFAHLVTADIGVDTSLQAEVSPVKAMEYMGCGLPVVSFDLPETRTITAGAGVLVPPGDVDALARAVLDLVDDPRQRRVLGESGRARVRAWLCWERQSREYVRVVGPGAEEPPPQGQPYVGEQGGVWKRNSGVSQVRARRSARTLST